MWLDLWPMTLKFNRVLQTTSEKSYKLDGFSTIFDDWKGLPIFVCLEKNVEYSELSKPFMHFRSFWNILMSA